MATLSKTKHPGIYLTETGSYRVIVTLPDGKQRKVTAPNLSEAKRMQAELRTDVSNQVVVTGTHTLQSYYDQEWLPRIKRDMRKPSVITYRNKMEKWVLPSLGRVRLTDLTAPQVRKFQDSMHGSLSRQSVCNVMVPLKAMLSAACEDGLIKANVGRNVKAPVKGPDKDAKVRWLSQAEQERFFSVVNPEWTLFFRTLVETGLRISELLALDWQSLSVDRKLNVRRRFAYGEMMPPKSGRSRTVPVSEDLYAALTLLHKASDFQGPADLIFPSKYTGRPMHQGHIARDILHPALAEVGIRGIAFHIFRHTAATTWWEAGVPLLKVSRLLGHASLAVTEQTYVHFRTDDLVDMNSIYPTTPSPVPAPQEVHA